MTILESYEERVTQKKMVGVELASGALDLSTSKRGDGVQQAKVETTNAFAEVAPESTASARYDPADGESQFRVSRGEAEVFNKQNRQSLRLSANEEVSTTGTQLQKTELPDPPKLLSPSNSEVFNTNSPTTTTVALRWNPVPGAKSYRVTISPKDRFYPVVYENTSRRPRMSVKGLPFGIFYWRVVAIDNNNVEGYPSNPPGMFAMRPRKLNPAESIRFEMTKIVVMGNILEVFGNTDPDNIVHINNKKVRLERDGTFKHFTDPFKGSASARLNITIKDYSGAVKKITRDIPLD
jgi:hypothetical protein